MVVHLYFLHNQGSSNPLGRDRNVDKLFFHPFFTIKDIFFLFGVILIFIVFCFYLPYITSDPVNNIPANFIQTPLHIQPE